MQTFCQRVYSRKGVLKRRDSDLSAFAPSVPETSFFSPERWEIEDRTLFMTLLSTIVPKHSATKTKLKGYYKVNTGHRLSGWDALLFMLTTIQQIAILWYQNSQINHLRLFNTITNTVWEFLIPSQALCSENLNQASWRKV